MIIGVTGGIGSGKSTVLRAVAKRGYPIYDCDAEAKRIIVEDADVRRQLIATFGDETYQGYMYNTRYVAEQVFADHDKLARLNAIVHPAVKQDVMRWAADKQIAFIETAILFQAGMSDLCAGVAVVTVPEEERIARALHRDRHASREDIVRRIRAQRPPEDYLASYSKPSIILVNDDDTPHRVLADQLIQFAQSL
ncbi:MAG: dephospho-CoA kinase [Paludibacteraceae bacterium]|nr:dephospho-CoA kinase [Paludibacteraceae bacterium]